jgi:hypothetical protein
MSPKPDNPPEAREANIPADGADFATLTPSSPPRSSEGSTLPAAESSWTSWTESDRTPALDGDSLQGLLPTGAGEAEQATPHLTAGSLQGQSSRTKGDQAGASTNRTAQLVELLYSDLAHRLDTGRALPIGDYLDRYPELGDAGAVDLIARDFELRHQRGMAPKAETYLAQFPRLAFQLTTRLDAISRNQTETVVSPRRPPLNPPIAATGLAGQLPSKFQLVEKLGEGGMGEVWRVRRPDLGIERAVKLILPRNVPSLEARARMLREARAMARISHPHAAMIHDVGTEDVPHIEMELIQGKPLNKVIQPKVPMPLEATLQILEQLCDVLQLAHDFQIVHRDLKPSNLMLVDGHPDGKIVLKVLDFGLAKFLDATPDTFQTGHGETLGTLAYMSPEQVTASNLVDKRSDIYSVGVILYELLTGWRPFVSPYPLILHEIMTVPAPRFKVRNPDVKVSRGVERLVLRCLDKDPARRPSSARSLIEEFRRLTAPPAPEVRPGPSRRLVLVGLAGVAGIGGVSVYRFLQGPLPPGWARAREGAGLVWVRSKLYPSVIERQIDGVRVAALLIEKQRGDGPEPFYIMRDKVWVRLFEAFARTRPALLKDPRWRDESDPRLPVRNVTGEEAQAFAEWLGGRGRGFLPTCAQWDEAAGLHRKDGRAGPFREPWDPRDPGQIAVGRNGPLPVGQATHDVSPSGCRDMSGNGWEWTRLPSPDANAAEAVDLRANSFKSGSPFKFEQIKKGDEDGWPFNQPDPAIGFRVVIEMDPKY